MCRGFVQRVCVCWFWFLLWQGNKPPLAKAVVSCFSHFKNIGRTFINRRHSVWAHRGVLGAVIGADLTFYLTWQRIDKTNLLVPRNNFWPFAPFCCTFTLFDFLVKWEMWSLLREPRPVWGRLRCAGLMLIQTLLARRANANMYFKSQVFVRPTRLFRFYDHVTLLIGLHKASSPWCHDKATACCCDVKNKQAVTVC